MVGCSKYTLEKWKRVEYLSKTQSKMAIAAIGKRRFYSNTYYYFDFYAGPGKYPEGSRYGLAGNHGSPVLVAKVLDECFNKNRTGPLFEDLEINYRMLFCENDPLVFSTLKSCLSDLSIDAIVFDKTCEETVEKLVDKEYWRGLNGPCEKPSLGLAFFDWNGIPAWDHIKVFSETRHFNRVDLLVNIPASTEKLARISPNHRHQGTTSSHLKSLKKDYIYLWNPLGHYQFTLAFCTNMPENRFPEFPNLGFHYIESDKGKMIADTIDFSKKERNERRSYHEV